MSGVGRDDIGWEERREGCWQIHGDPRYPPQTGETDAAAGDRRLDGVGYCLYPEDCRLV